MKAMDKSKDIRKQVWHEYSEHKENFLIFPICKMQPCCATINYYLSTQTVIITRNKDTIWIRRGGERRGGERGERREQPCFELHIDFYSNKCDTVYCFCSLASCSRFIPPRQAGDDDTCWFELSHCFGVFATIERACRPDLNSCVCVRVLMLLLLIQVLLSLLL